MVAQRTSSCEFAAPDAVAENHQTGTGSPVANLVGHIVMSRATELARAGRYEDAEVILEAMLPAGMPVAALDLLARIRAQQGRLAEAKALWLQVSQLNPQDAAARAALARIDKIESRKPSRTATALTASFAKKPAPSDRETALAGRPAGMPEQFRVCVPGAALQKLDDDVLVTFEFSLFSGPGAQLEDRAKSALSALGWQLEPYVGTIAIEVVGQPDALPYDTDPPPRDVSAIGMARADAVFNHLIETTKLQARMFTLRTGEDFLLADSTDCREANGANSAIVLRISRTGRHHDAPTGG